MRLHVKSLGSAGLGLLILLAAVSGWAKGPAAGTPPNVAIVRTAAWSQGDPAREGASELVILMKIARLRQEYAQGGLIAVGDRRGLFSAGAEEALRHAVLQGVPVVKLASSGRVLLAPHGLFLDGRDLSEEEARQVLARCLERYGALPSGGGATATPELRARLRLFQQEFVRAAGTRIALQ
jgi:hypothetical protein